jgi:hypothetical protein
MNRVGALSGVVVTMLLVLALPAFSQDSRCADCHFANPDAPSADHLNDWSRSSHAKSKIGCEKCHGGDPNTFEAALAHRGVLNSANPSSPVNERNLSATCGACHPGAFVAFQKSRHYALITKGDFRVPGCTSCHGGMGSRSPSSPRALESQCRQCHGPNGIAKKMELPEQARAMYEAIDESRNLLNVTHTLVSQVTDKTRRARLEQAYQQAEVPLTEAVQAGHAFVFDDLKERLSTARRRIDALLTQLANPQ